MQKIHILVVDDNQENLEGAKSQFKGKNVNLICCNLFSVASKMMQSKKFDIVLTDLMIPGEADGVSSNNPEVGKEVPYGLVVSIMAKNMGVPHVAILTDINHHAGPIAWAMDNVLGTHPFISCFNEGKKDWLRAAEKFAVIEEVVGKEDVATKKSFMLVGVNDDYKKTLQDHLQTDFNVIFINSNDTKNAPIVFAEQNPDFSLLIGEITGSVNEDEKRVFGKLLQMKKSEQSVVAAGWMDSDDPHYLRLPFTMRDLREKVGF